MLSRSLYCAPRESSWVLPDGQQGVPTEGRDSFVDWRRSRSPHAQEFCSRKCARSPIGPASYLRRVLSNSTLSKLLRKLGISAVSNGFHSSFRDWATEQTDLPRKVCEIALAHVDNDRVEAAYRRSDLFDCPENSCSIGPTITRGPMALLPNEPRQPRRQISALSRSLGVN